MIGKLYDIKIGDHTFEKVVTIDKLLRCEWIRK